MNALKMDLLLKLRQLNTHTTGALFSMCNKLLTYDLLINNLLITALLWAYSHIVTRERFQIAPSLVSAGLKTQCVMLLHAKKNDQFILSDSDYSNTMCDAAKVSCWTEV